MVRILVLRHSAAARSLDEREYLLAVWGEIACRHAALIHLMRLRPGPALRAAAECDSMNSRVDLEAFGNSSLD
jgi:hypothetical protein